MEQVKPTHRLIHMKAFGDSSRIGIYCWKGKLLWGSGPSVIKAGTFNIFHLPVIDIGWREDADLITLNILKEVYYGTI